MKTLIIILASCTALGLNARATESASRFGEVPVQTIRAKVPANGDTVAVGTSRVAVALRLGSPNTVLPDGSWLYSDYVVRLHAADAGRPASLIVRFTAGQVSRLTLADRPAVMALRPAPRPAAPEQFLAAAQTPR